MDRKGIKLVEAALRGHDDGIEQFRIRSRWNAVADHVDDWEEVRQYIAANSFIPRNKLQAFEDACTKYNESHKTSQGLSTKQKVGLLAGSAILGFVLGMRK